MALQLYHTWSDTNPISEIEIVLIGSLGPAQGFQSESRSRKRMVSSHQSIRVSNASLIISIDVLPLLHHSFCHCNFSAGAVGKSAKLNTDFS